MSGDAWDEVRALRAEVKRLNAELERRDNIEDILVISLGQTIAAWRELLGLMNESVTRSRSDEDFMHKCNAIIENHELVVSKAKQVIAANPARKAAESPRGATVAP